MKAGLKAIYLSGWQVAADANIAGEMYPDQSLYPVNSVPHGRAPDQQHVHARRPDPAHGRQGRHRLLRADRRRRRGRLRRRAERVRADEGDDRGGRRRRPLRGPARVGQEVRPHGRQGARADARGGREARRRAARRRLHGRADDPARAHRRRGGRPRDLRRRRRSTSRSAPASARSRASTGRATASTRRSSRGLAYAPYADLIWCETGKPDLAFAKAFAEAIQAKFPGKMLAYNCSPSFNWKKNLDDATIAKFQRELGAMGYKFQFITLAGFHSLNYSMFNLAHGYARSNMTRIRRAAGSRVRRRREGLHRGPAPARGRHRLLRRGDDDGAGQPVVDDGAVALDRGRAVLRQEGREGHEGRRVARAVRRGSRAVREDGAALFSARPSACDGCASGRPRRTLTVANGAATGTLQPAAPTHRCVSSSRSGPTRAARDALATLARDVAAQTPAAALPRSRTCT